MSLYFMDNLSSVGKATFWGNFEGLLAPCVFCHLASAVHILQLQLFPFIRMYFLMRDWSQPLLWRLRPFLFLWWIHGLDDSAIASISFMVARSTSPTPVK